MDRLTRIEVFIRVAEEGSFSAAARSLKSSQPSISKAIAELEQQLKTRLLHRTTRRLSLTEAGTAYYRQIKRVVAMLDEANNGAATGQKSISGRLRVNTSAMLAGKLVLPAVMAFKTVHPAVEVEIAMDDRRIDLVERATDVAVRVGSLSNSTLRVRRAGAAAMGIFAAPSYLSRLGTTAEGLNEVTSRHLIQYAEQRAPIAGSLATEISLTVSNALLARDASVAGAGLAIVPQFLVADDVTGGQLVQVLPNIPLPTMEVSLLHPFTQDAPQSVTAFIDFAIGMWRESTLLQP